QNLGGEVWVVKAQIYAGGRGKGGGVKVARSLEEVRQLAGDMLGMRLVTHQTGPDGQTVRRLFIEEGVNIAREYYVGMVVDRGSQRVCLMASDAVGMDIEQVAAQTPEKIHKLYIDPIVGLADSEALVITEKIGIPDVSRNEAVALLKKLYQAFDDKDASLVEINPLALTTDHHVLALDAKM